MRRIFTISVATVVCALATVASAQTPSAGAPAGRKPRVAVFDFEYATVHSNVSAIFGRDIDIGKGVTDLLVTYLVKDGSFSVIECNPVIAGACGAVAVDAAIQRGDRR